MGTQQGTVRVRRRAGSVLFQLDGWATINQGIALRRETEEALARGDVCVHVDLRCCTYMDSTFLGTLLYLQRAANARGGEFTLVAPSPSCRELLEKMRLDGVFSFSTAPAADGPDWVEVPCEPAERPALETTVLDAHQELAQVEGPTGQQFQAVARLLNQQAGCRNR
jgi:anti-anti-sigma factor